MVSISSTYDFETIKALAHVAMFGKINPKKHVCLFTVFGLLFAATFIVLLLTLPDDYTFPRALTLAVLIAAFVIEYAKFFYFPRLKYRSLGEKQQMLNHHRIGDTSFMVRLEEQDCELPYTVIAGVFETSRYFFLFIGPTKGFVLDKSTVDTQAVANIRHKLSVFFDTKYTICNY